MATSYYFPDDIIAYIVQFADVPIDTSLAFGVKPKNIIMPNGIEDKLNSLCTRRLKYITKNNIINKKFKASACSHKICYSILEQVSTIIDGNELMCKYYIDMDGEYYYSVTRHTSDYQYNIYRLGTYRISDGSKAGLGLSHLVFTQNRGAFPQ